MRVRCVVLTIIVVALVLPAVAVAHRPATGAETRAMLSAGGEARSVPLRCFAADISTVVPGSQWGAWSFSRYAIRPSNQRRCETGNGESIEHKVARNWHVLWSGDEGYPQNVPRRIAKDLLAGIPDL
jgi:hypothetical protein